MRQPRETRPKLSRRTCLLVLGFVLGPILLGKAHAGRYDAKFGIYYAVWHCAVAIGNPDGRPVYDISKILLGQEPWGPVSEFHWWSKPAAGYYCLANNDAVLKQHAMLLRDAGIDFIYVDSTNWPYVDDRDHLDSDTAVRKPYKELLKVWNEVPNAPKVVPWAPLTQDSDMLQFLSSRLDAYPKLKFYYQGKPLVLAVRNDTFPVDRSKLALLATTHTVRTMWAFFPKNPVDGWTSIQDCAAGFRASGATRTCHQSYAVHNGTAEEVPIAGSYQETYISEKADATPRFHGRTFVKQFETLFNYPEARIALIYGWNEWIAQRFCFNSAGDPTSSPTQCSTDHFPDGTKVFVDEYSSEYSKDIEPAAGPPGDHYYRLMKVCIGLYRQGRTCNEESVPGRERGAP